MVTRDHEMIRIFSDLFREIGVAVETYVDESSAAHGLGVARFEALVLDLDNMNQSLQVISSLRESRSSKNALVFAVASDKSARQRALEQGANFAFERPFQRLRIKQVLHIAYGLMLRDCRRYFRHAASLAVHLQRVSGTELRCTTINISRSGMAVNVPCPLDLGEKLRVAFAVPGAGFSLDTEGRVIWDDKHGKAGLSFQCTNLEQQNRLDTWLDDQFYKQVNDARTTFQVPQS